MKRMRHCFLLACVFAAFPAMAQGDAYGGVATMDEELLAGQNFAGFVNSHPDLSNYRQGLDAYRGGDMVKAYRYFRAAAGYSDKPSQAIIAEMHWQGQGVERDRALAYAWSDLAAERGNPRLLAQRERYWQVLDEAERARALQVGERIYAEFGDEVTQPRLERALRWSKRRSIGGKTGYMGNTQIIAKEPRVMDGSGEGMVPVISMPASAFYASKFWDPKEYYTWRDRLWELEIREIQSGQVEVGEVEKVRSAD